MSGAPYGYRYISKTDKAPAAYTVLETEARVVRRVYEMYTVEGLSIGEITRRINAESILTRKASALGTLDRLGGCCATPPIEVLLASARRAPLLARVLPAQNVGEV